MLLFNGLIHYGLFKFSSEMDGNSCSRVSNENSSPPFFVTLVCNI
jgi:hypothetical protein